MLRLPTSVHSPSSPAFWLFASVLVVIHLGFFVSLVWWVVKYRNPLGIAGGYFLSHTAVATIVLPFLFSATGEEAWALSLYLMYCIDLPSLFLLVMTDLDLNSPTMMAIAYVIVGGGIYALIGLIVGSVAWLLRGQRIRHRTG
ncbi:MAG: hypothetical protein K1X71_21250 [Pirellulales bacterium]|nr:hypothetical protein [Pirellulales bacterium]